MRGIFSSVVLGATCVVSTLAWSCTDPVHDAQVDALGPETAGVPPGPDHRPGKPCLTCHGGKGPADLELSVAGTIYQTAASDSPPLVGATVQIYDATRDGDGGAPRSFATNGAGNFFVRATEWSPVFPLHDIAITYPGIDVPVTMHTVVGRDGSCGTCHFEPRSTDTHGHVYLVVEAADLPGAQP